MEYDNSNRTHVHAPDFVGAIFMCNKHTKEDCLKKRLFGLPSKLSGFVKQVKRGMVLFLFEHEERKLNGVFMATSDGALNIVPSAFPMSRKNFPAQVSFERLWACKPLSENEFSEAIKENYWTPKKFNFALSSQQVHKLIWLFSSKICLPCDEFPTEVQSDCMKMLERSSLARIRLAENDNLLKFDVAGYSMNHNIQSDRNAALSRYTENQSTGYQNHVQDTILLNQGRYRPHPAVSYTFGSQLTDQMILRHRKDIAVREGIPVSSTNHPYCSSSSFLHKQPSMALLDMDHACSLEKKLAYSTSSLETQAPHTRSKSYTSDPCIRNTYSRIDLSKTSPIYKHRRPTFHASEGHVSFLDISQNSFPESYELPSSKFSLLPQPGLRNTGSASIFLRNACACSQPSQSEEDSWRQDRPSESLTDYIPLLKDENLVSDDYVSLQEDQFAVNAKKDLDFFRKEKWPSAMRYDYPLGVFNDCNVSDSDTDTFPESDRSQKRCSAFNRLSWAPNYFQCSSLDQASRISESSEFLETNKPLDLIDEFRLPTKYSLVGAEQQEVVGTKPQVDVRFDDNNLPFLNFKRRSLVKEQSIGESNVIKCAVKYKRRKIVRPSFNGEDILANAGPSAGDQVSHDEHTIPFADSGHDIEGSVNVKENCIKVPAKEQSFYKESTAHVEDADTA